MIVSWGLHKVYLTMKNFYFLNFTALYRTFFGSALKWELRILARYEAKKFWNSGISSWTLKGKL